MKTARLGICAGGGFGLERFVVDDGAKNFAAADNGVAGARFDFEGEKAAILSNQASRRDDARAGCDGFQVIDFDACADGDKSGRKMRANGAGRGAFHHADHRGSGKDGRQSGIERGKRPFAGNDFFKPAFEAQGKLRRSGPFGRGHRAGSLRSR